MSQVAGLELARQAMMLTIKEQFSVDRIEENPGIHEERIRAIAYVIEHGEIYGPIRDRQIRA